MKKCRVCIVISLCAILMISCGTRKDNESVEKLNASTLEKTAVSRNDFGPLNFEIQKPITFVWEKPGIGGEFTITLEAGGKFQFYEGLASSFMGYGHYDIEDGILTLNVEDIDPARTYKFNISEDLTGLRFIKDSSDDFIYVDVEDGSLFSPLDL